ncbi:MAG: L-seryl-tRNA(Sec) selenium transferase, partial [Longimicrobiales bacterium]
DTRVVAGTSAVGGGAAASAAIPTSLVLIGREGWSAHELERRLRAGTPALVARIVDDRVAIDLRTVPTEDDAALLSAVAGAARG